MRISDWSSDVCSSDLPQFFSHPDDIELLLTGVKLGRRILRAQAFMAERPRELYLDGIEDDDGLLKQIRSRADTIYHPVGSRRMGAAHDAQAVVDPQLQIGHAPLCTPVTNAHHV